MDKENNNCSKPCCSNVEHRLSTTTSYNLLVNDDHLIRFIPTGFTDGDSRLFYVIEESPYDNLQSGTVDSFDVLDNKDIETVFGIQLPAEGNPISRTIKTIPNDKELGSALRNRQVKLEQSNPTMKFEKYAN